MPNPTESNQQIQNVERELQKGLEEIRQKEAQIKEIENRNNALTMDVRKADTTIRQKQQEVLHAQQEMDAKKREIDASSRNSDILKQSVARLKLDQLQKTNTMNTLIHQQKESAAQQKNIQENKR